MSANHDDDGGDVFGDVATVFDMTDGKVVAMSVVVFQPVERPALRLARNGQSLNVRLNVVMRNHLLTSPSRYPPMTSSSHRRRRTTLPVTSSWLITQRLAMPRPVLKRKWATRSGRVTWTTWTRNWTCMNLYGSVSFQLQQSSRHRVCNCACVCVIWRYVCIWVGN